MVGFDELKLRGEGFRMGRGSTFTGGQGATDGVAFFSRLAKAGSA